MKLPVIARGITHLTDARYFAALEVDYIAFDMKGISPEMFHAIIEWIEGPQIVLENIGESGSDYLTISSFLESKELPDRGFIEIGLGNLTKENISQDLHYIIQLEESSTVSKEQLQYIANNCNKGQVFLQLSESSTNIVNLCINDYPSIGIVLQGSLEEETGIKSFEHLDPIIDLLEYED